VLPSVYLCTPGLSSRAWKYFSAIAWLATNEKYKKGFCDAGNDYLSAEFGRNRRTFPRWNKIFERLGLIRVDIINRQGRHIRMTKAGIALAHEIAEALANPEPEAPRIAAPKPHSALAAPVAVKSPKTPKAAAKVAAAVTKSAEIDANTTPKNDEKAALPCPTVSHPMSHLEGQNVPPCPTLYDRFFDSVLDSDSILTTTESGGRTAPPSRHKTSKANVVSVSKSLSPEQKTMAQKLVDEGVDTDVAVDLAATHAPELIQEQIDVMHTLTPRKNPGGYLRSAITTCYPHPWRKVLEAKKALCKAQAEHETKDKAATRTERANTLAIIKAMPEAEYAALEKDAKDQISDKWSVKVTQQRMVDIYMGRYEAKHWQGQAR
jgi:hypothetical protein